MGFSQYLYCINYYKNKIQVNYVAGGHLGFQAEVVNSAPAVHAVKKVVAPVAVAPVAAYGHGYGHGYGHEYAAPIAKAVAAPIAYGHGTRIESKLNRNVFF